MAPPRSLSWPRLLPYLLLAPSVIVLLLVTAYPLLFALRSSFYFWNLQMSAVPLGFDGFDNYVSVLTGPYFLVSLRNTLLLTLVGTTLQFVLGLAIAHLLLARLPGMSVARALLIMPTTIAPVVVGFLFRYMYDPQGGLAPWLLNLAHIPIPRQGLLGSSATALWSVLAADVWEWTPFCAIVLYAALLSIPRDILEAARLDGASAWGTLRRITLPAISKTASIVLVLRFMQLFNTFDLVLVLTRGGPGDASRTLGYSLYQTGLVDFNIGLASAMTWIIVIIVNAFVALWASFLFKGWER
jgi:multiple sugar transport system permease protein